MVKSEEQIFDIKDSKNIQIVENEAPSKGEAPPKKQKKKRAPLKDDEKAQLIARLKAGRERKKKEREQNKNNKEADEPKQSPKARLDTPPPQSIDTSNNDLSNEIRELKKQIKETKEKQELFELKNELKELNELKKKNKNNNNNKSENVEIKKVRIVPPILKTKAADIRPVAKKEVILPPKPKILKRRIR